MQLDDKKITGTLEFVALVALFKNHILNDDIGYCCRCDWARTRVLAGFVPEMWRLASAVPDSWAASTDWWSTLLSVMPHFHYTERHAEQSAARPLFFINVDGDVKKTSAWDHTFSFQILSLLCTRWPWTFWFQEAIICSQCYISEYFLPYRSLFRVTRPDRLVGICCLMIN